MKKLERKISIIIPAYNAEKTIKKCLESIIENNYSNKEIIIVNNESTDNSLKIIKEYEKKYNFVKVYKSTSSLAGGVKNLGIKKCTGDYFVVVDADDYVENSFLDKLNNVMQKKEYSLIRFNANYDEKGNEGMFITSIKKQEYNSTDYLKMVIEEYLKYNKIFGPTWLYAYNREFFIKNRFKFKNKFQEDYGLTPQIIIKAKNIFVMNDRIYDYVYNYDGMTNKTSNTLAKALDVIYHSEMHLKKINDVNSNIREQFINYICETLNRKYKKLNISQKEIFRNRIERSGHIGKYFNINNNTIV